MSDLSDEDAPVTISFKRAKNEHETEASSISDFLKRRKELKKEARRAKTEFLRNQKVEKRQKSEKKVTRRQKKPDRRLSEDVVDSLPEPVNESDLSTIFDEDEPIPGMIESLESLEKDKATKTPISKKIYEKLSIKVESLPQIENKRAESALDFKTKRLSKPHRESVHKVQIHHEKLIASGNKVLIPSTPIVSMKSK